MELKYNKIQTTGTDTLLKIVKGHFATNYAHTNYYFDLTTVKSRLMRREELPRHSYICICTI